jgi:hypothetical protein
MNIADAAAICHAPFQRGETSTDTAGRMLSDYHAERRDLDAAAARLKPHLPALNARLAAAGYGDNLRALELAQIDARAVLRGLISVDAASASLRDAAASALHMATALEAVP